MISHFPRTAMLPVLLMCALLPSAFAADHASEKYRVNAAPSADLDFSIRARQSGFGVDGEAHIKWQHGDGTFVVTNETRAMLVGKILDSKSEGAIDDFGLAPDSFSEKRFRKAATTTTFHRDSKSISFSASDESYPLKGGEQDRASAIWQLIGVARANGAKFKPGSSWSFFVAGQRDAEPWIFHVTKMEKISTPLGELNTVRVVKSPPPDQQGQQVDIWLTPSLEWYPARLRYTEADGDYVEQTLVTVTRRPDPVKSADSH